SRTCRWEARVSGTLRSSQFRDKNPRDSSLDSARIALHFYSKLADIQPSSVKGFTSWEAKSSIQGEILPSSVTQSSVSGPRASQYIQPLPSTLTCKSFSRVVETGLTSEKSHVLPASCW